MSTHVYCALDSQHAGPYARYTWNERKGVMLSRLVPTQGFLCEKCAKAIGAWALPEKKEGETNVSK